MSHSSPPLSTFTDLTCPLTGARAPRYSGSRASSGSGFTISDGDSTASKPKPCSWRDSRRISSPQPPSRTQEIYRSTLWLQGKCRIHGWRGAQPHLRRERCRNTRGSPQAKPLAPGRSCSPEALPHSANHRWAKVSQQIPILAHVLGPLGRLPRAVPPTSPLEHTLVGLGRGRQRRG